MLFGISSPRSSAKACRKEMTEDVLVKLQSDPLFSRGGTKSSLKVVP